MAESSLYTLWRAWGQVPGAQAVAWSDQRSELL